MSQPNRRQSTVRKHLAAGMSLAEACRQPGTVELPVALKWMRVQEDFRTDVLSSRDAHADELLREIIRIADEAGPTTGEQQRAAKRIQARKEWLGYFLGEAAEAGAAAPADASTAVPGARFVYGFGEGAAGAEG